MGGMIRTFDGIARRPADEKYEGDDGLDARNRARIRYMRMTLC